MGRLRATEVGSEEGRMEEVGTDRLVQSFAPRRRQIDVLPYQRCAGSERIHEKAAPRDRSASPRSGGERGFVPLQRWGRLPLRISTARRMVKQKMRMFNERSTTSQDTSTPTPMRVVRKGKERRGGRGRDEMGRNVRADVRLLATACVPACMRHTRVNVH